MPVLDLVEVYIAQDRVEASAVLALLHGADLDPRLRDMTITPYPVSFGPMGEKRIAVPREQGEEARRLLRQAIEDGYLRRHGIVVENEPSK